MKKTLLALIAVIGIATSLLFGGMKHIHSEVNEKESEIERPILISAIEKLRELEEARVQFYHAKHVTTLEKEGCVVCHSQDEKGRFNFQFPKTRNEKSKRSLMNSYHDSCLGCHNERLETGQKTGPIACGECHVPREEKEWIQPFGFDYFLHYQHEKAMEKKCEACHHSYSEEEKKLIYKEGTESSCRDCHRQEDEQNRKSFRKVAHFGCINCHMEKEKEGKKAGPIACANCHAEIKKRTIEELAEVPRPNRKQPEKVLITIDNAGMKEVPFDHKGHELNTRSCRDCHHETLAACKNCHTLKGATEGGGVTLADAYHNASSQWSCIGCHELQKAEASCAGCHYSMEIDLKKKSCVICHAGPVEEPETGSLSAVLTIDDLLPPDLAAKLSIDGLKSEYDASQFPHFKIIEHLTNISNENKLASYFHHDRTTICLGCHHYSPMEPKSRPPLCGNCHTVSFNPEDLSKPRLLAAYHLQCMGCHAKMDLKAQGCTDCHAAKGEGKEIPLTTLE